MVEPARRRTDPRLKRFTIGLAVGVVLGVLAFLVMNWCGSSVEGPYLGTDRPGYHPSRA